ncbi:hypothetical protein IFM89_014204 [Coptis chinensis]|uniref:Uncharacterized protein n=1 Tax=Coptis chinensis TaxID=261450 RepID=A0A835MF55_9MAGN|nr:hypothetical protein IFM89_014204 [Coptis chinensis]
MLAQARSSSNYEFKGEMSEMKSSIARVEGLLMVEEITTPLLTPPIANFADKDVFSRGRVAESKRICKGLPQQAGTAWTSVNNAIDEVYIIDICKQPNRWAAEIIVSGKWESEEENVVPPLTYKFTKLRGVNNDGGDLGLTSPALIDNHISESWDDLENLTGVNSVGDPFLVATDFDDNNLLYPLYVPKRKLTRDIIKKKRKRSKEGEFVGCLSCLGDVSDYPVPRTSEPMGVDSDLSIHLDSENERVSYIIVTP